METGRKKAVWEKSPHPLVPILEPGMTSPLQGLPGFAQCKYLPTWQFLTPASSDVPRPSWRVSPNTWRLANTPHENKETRQLFTFASPSLGPLARGARTSLGMETPGGRLAN